MPKLLLMDATGQVRQIPLATPTTSLGRSPDSDVVLDSKRASREHALIEMDGPRAVIVDLHSLNGTLVNGELIDRHPLAHGDSIEIGGRWTIVDERRDLFSHCCMHAHQRLR